MVKGCRGVIAGLVVICTMSTSMAATAVERHGWLKTQGGYLLNEHGNIVQLRGLSFYWSNPAWSGYSYYNEGTLNALVDQWKCTVVRLAYDRDHGNNNGWDGVQTVLNAAIKKGIYVIIDWHAHDAHNNEGAAVQFFREQAQKYKNTPNVIFEPYNEPINLSGNREDGTQTTAEATWKGIKGYLKNVTQAIRDEGSKNLVILGTPFFCQFVNVAAGDQIKDKNGNTFENVAYAFHFYSASHGPEAYYVKGGDVGGMEGEYLQGGLGKVPVFVTEWGTTHSDGGEAHDYIDAENTEWWFSKFIDGQYKLSHCNWSVSNFEPSSAFSGGTSPSASGKIAQKYIRSETENSIIRCSDKRKTP